MFDKPNLVQLFTCHGPMYIDTRQLANLSRNILTIYTARGNRVSEVGKTKSIRERASFGVHRGNLYASQALAIEARERIYAEIFSKPAESTTAVRS